MSIAATTLLGTLRERVGRLPGVLQWRKWRYAKAFASLERTNLYSGVYDSYESALASAPDTKPTGYDNDDAAAMYANLEVPLPSDAPAIEWIQRAFDEGSRQLVDLGGHVGIKYYAFRPALRWPEDARWEVCDVPTVARRGADLANTRGVQESLRFTADTGCLEHAETLFASGSVQYFPVALPDMLRALTRLPTWVIVNRAALHPTRSFFTLNSIGVSFCPYRVQAEPEFSAAMTELGYSVQARWETPRAFRIPFEPDHDFDQYVGLVYRL